MSKEGEEIPERDAVALRERLSGGSVSATDAAIQERIPVPLQLADGGETIENRSELLATDDDTEPTKHTEVESRTDD